MGKVIMSREKNLAGAAIEFKIYLDDQFEDCIKNGGTLEFKTNSGIHELYVLAPYIGKEVKSNVVQFKDSDISTAEFKVRQITGLIRNTVEVTMVSNSFSEADVMNKYDDLQKLFDLKEKGIISEAEYNAEKQKVLRGE